MTPTGFGSTGTPRVFRPVPSDRLAAAAAVLAACPRVLAGGRPPRADHRTWELVDPCAGPAEFAAAVAVTAQSGDGVSAGVVAVAVSEPDVVATATRLLYALTEELTRTGVRTISVGVDRTSPQAAAVLAAAGFILLDRGLRAAGGDVWRRERA